MATPLVLTLSGGVVLVFSVIEFGGGIAAYRGQNWYGSMTAAVPGLATVFTLPPDLVATVLLAVGEGTFDEE